MTGMGNMCIIESRNTKQYFTCAIPACPGGDPDAPIPEYRSRFDAKKAGWVFTSALQFCSPDESEVVLCPGCAQRKFYQLATGAKKMSDLQQELASVLNRHSAENGSDTPDFILAQYLLGCLDAWNTGVTAREQWYGRTPRRTLAWKLAHHPALDQITVESGPSHDRGAATVYFTFPDRAAWIRVWRYNVKGRQWRALLKKENVETRHNRLFVSIGNPPRHIPRLAVQYYDKDDIPTPVYLSRLRRQAKSVVVEADGEVSERTFNEGVHFNEV